MTVHAYVSSRACAAVWHCLQTMVLQSAIKQGLLPADAASHMSVIVHVHSNLASFLYSQACMTAQGK